MSKTMLIYQKVAPLNKKSHANWGIKNSNTFSFARDINSVPLTAVEFPAASLEFSIVFAKSEDGLVPIAVMGVRHKENLYVDEAGKWQARYIPAFIRRYPFVFSTSDDGNTLTLCLDEDYEGCSPDGEGDRLFTETGENSPYLDKVVDFLKEYQAQHAWVYPPEPALRLIIDGKAEIVEADGVEPVRSERMRLPRPAIIRLVRFVHVPRRFRRQVTNTFLFARDGYTCQYCSRPGSVLKPRECLTRDHVIPQSRGGTNLWNNVVTAPAATPARAIICLTRSGCGRSPFRWNRTSCICHGRCADCRRPSTSMSGCSTVTKRWPHSRRADDQGMLKRRLCAVRV